MTTVVQVDNSADRATRTTIRSSLDEARMGGQSGIRFLTVEGVREDRTQAGFGPGDAHSEVRGRSKAEIGGRSRLEE